MLNTKSALRTMSFMIFATLTAKMLGLLREILLAGSYGTGPEAVAFLTASRIPLLFFDLGLGASISSTFIPVFNEYLGKRQKEKAIQFSNYFINIVLLICGAFTIIGILFANQWVNIVAAGLEEPAYSLTVNLVRILFPMIIFTGLAFSFVGILQSYDQFNIPALISLVSNIIVVLYFAFLNKYFGIYGLAIAMLIGWFSQVLIQIPSLIKKGYRYRPIISFKDPGIKRVAVLILPILVSTWVQPINATVNIRLATFLNEGQAVAALEYANKLYIIVVGVFTYALTNLIFPSLSRMSAAKDEESFRGVLNTAIRGVVYFILPLMTGFILLRTPMIRLVYERGAFDEFSTNLTATALLFYSIGMLGFGIQEVLNKSFYALQDAKTPMKISVGGIMLNIIMSMLLVNYMGIGGLALAASIAAIIISSLLLRQINKRIVGVINKEIIVYAIKIVVCCILMGIIVVITRDMLYYKLEGNTVIYRLIKFGIPVFVGATFYGILTYVLRIKEARFAVEAIANKLKRM